MQDNVQVTTTETTTEHVSEDLGARMAKVLGDLQGGASIDALAGVPAEEAPAVEETPAEPKAKRGADGKFLKKAEPAKAETPAEEPKPDHDAERREKLARVNALERENYAKAAKLTERERSAETREATLTERETRVKEMERAFTDPEALLALVEERVGVEKFNQWILEQAQPDKRAAHAAKKAASAVEEKLAKLQEELRAKEAKLDAERRELAERQAFEQAATALSTRVKEVADEAPLVARFFDKRPQAAARMADQVARSFQGAEFNFDDVIIRMQEALASDAEIFGAQQSAATGNPSTDRAPSPSAAAKAKTTVSNRDAAERSSIVTPDDEADLPLEERARRAIERRRLRSVR